MLMGQRPFIGMFSRALPLIAFTVVILFSVVVPFDTDLGWHLRYGGYFIDHLGVLRANELTYFMDTYTWSHSYTLYQTMTSVLFNIGGIKALMIGYGLVLGGIFYAFFQIMRERIYISTLSVAVFSLFGLSTLSLGWRAQVFSVLFLLVLFLVLRVLNPVKRNVSLGVLFMGWVNVHGGFIVGLAIVGFDLIAKFQSEAKRDRIHLLVGFGFAIFATLLNPFGVDVYQEIVQHILTPMHLLIAEWVPPAFWVRVMYTAVLLGWIVFIIRSSKERSFFWVLCILLIWWLGITAHRNAIYVPLIFCVSAADLYKDKLAKFDREEIVRIAVWIMLVCGFLMGILQFSKVNRVVDDWSSYCSKGLQRYPCKAIEYLKANPLPDAKNIFTLFEWGGFLEWQLPSYKYFVDGRMPAWKTNDGVSPYSTYLNIIQAKEGYDQELHTYKTQAIVMPSGTFLDIALKDNSTDNWVEVYRDDVDVVYVDLED